MEGILNEKYLLNGIWQKAREIANVFAGFSAIASFCKVQTSRWYEARLNFNSARFQGQIFPAS
jgi:hypothetical protein